MSSLKICPQCGNEYELDQRFCPKDGTTLRSQGESSDLVGSIVADRYHVLRKLGQGGMGQVYLAEHVKMGRKSALKVMNPSAVKDADSISRFNREAANASRINHPNVADVYDFGETPDGITYLAMEYVDGPPLTKVIGEGSLSPLRAADITRQTADALAVAHDMGIVHRDLKPDNIMLARNRDGSDCVKVVDFGIAKAADNAAQKVTKTGLVVGTPEYMSPEQLAGDKLDGRSDIYALALVAFNMLTGKLPFPAETVQESMIMRLTDRPRKLSEMRPDLAWSPELQTVLDRALERDAARRYATASEFGRDIYRAVEAMIAQSGSPASGAATGNAASPSGNAASPSGNVASPTPSAMTSAEVVATTGPMVPPTRVGGAGVSAAQAPVTSGAPDGLLTELDEPAVQPKRNTRVLAAAAVILVVVLGGGALLAKKMFGPGEIPSVTLDGQAPSTDTAAFKKPLGSTGDAAASTAGAAGAGAVNVEFQLSQLEDSTNPNKGADSASAEKTIRAIESLRPHIQNNNELVHANLLEAEALMLVSNVPKACDLLKNIEGKAEGTRRTRVKSLLSLACS